MAEGLTKREQYFHRIESMAFSALPIPDGLLAAAPKHHDGVMVALVPDNPEELALDHEEALPADDLHVTLCYLGKVDQFSNTQKSDIIKTAHRVCDAAGQEFSVAADGVVIMGKNDQGVPATALLIQSDEIMDLYTAMAGALDYRSKYPSFIPHMTTGYGIPAEEAQELLGKPISFSNVLVKFGDERHTIPLSSALVAAPRGANVLDRVIDSLGRMWDEALHPRGADGRFIKKNGAVSGKMSVATADGKGVTTVDANRASVVGFHTFDNEVWVLAEITTADGDTVQGFAKADEVVAVAPVKARLDALYPVTDDEAFVPSSMERKRQIDLLLSHITDTYGPSNDAEGAQEFLDSLGLWDQDMDYIYDGDDPEFLGGIRRVEQDLSPDEIDEQQDIIEDARQVKELRERVHGLQEDSVVSEVVDFNDLGATYHNHERTEEAKARFRALPDDAIVRVYHGTTVENAEKLRESGIVDSEGRQTDLPTQALGALYVAPTTRDAENYGDAVVAFDVRKGDLQPSPEAIRSRMDGNVDLTTAFFNTFDGAILPAGYTTKKNPSSSNSETVTDSGLTPETVEAIRSGADPLSLDSPNLLAAMDESGRFEEPAQLGAVGVSPIGWRVDPADQTGTEVRMAGTGESTTGRAYFVKESVIGADMGNTDIVKEVLASLIAEQVADVVGQDDDRLIPIPKSRFGENPVWDGQPPVDNGPFDSRTHQPAYVVSSHADYAVPADWEKTTIGDEEVALYNDIKGLDEYGQADATAGHYEDMGEIYGNDIARLVMWDFLTLNGDRNPGNAILAAPPQGVEGRVLPIDHGFAFDESPVEGGNEAVFEWFMNYPFTQAWMNYVHGGIDMDSTVTPESIRQTLEDFTDVYSQISVNQILSRFRAMPNVSEAQIATVEKALTGVVDRAAWMRENMDMILRKMTRKSS